MYKLTYQSSYNYLSAENYFISSIEDVDFVYGHTYDDVISDFAKLIKKDFLSKLERDFNNKTTDSYYDYQILAIDEVTVEREVPDVLDLQPIKELVAEFKGEKRLESEKKKAQEKIKKERAKKRKEEKELKTYLKLKEKFEKSK
jgi:hypothetical protein